ncbi:UNVERIFIED_CONTAM: hypothetical protein Sradi_5075200 [Sesamum radiatum]|uniref:MULE transposase domain-containing protein n=1 Tax=Sesamum radiatum TaxID=300843 RepID=A0AAW2M2M5_SESRA
MNELRCHDTKDQAYRAKRQELEKLEGSPEYQYTRLWDYAEEVRKTNLGSTVILGTENENGEVRFSRLYVCFDALKQFLISGCRPIIGVDGCHLKGPYGGVLLTVVGIDHNNNIYPIAYAVVRNENGETWEWFLTVLKQDLNILRYYEYTFMFVKQKDLINAFQTVFSQVAANKHNNFKTTGFRGLAFKNALWRAARASTVGEYKMRMDEMKMLDASTYEWFNDKSPQLWSRSNFTMTLKCDIVE